MPWEGNANLLKIFRQPSGPLANNDVEDENGNVDEAVSPTAISTLLYGPINLIGQIRPSSINQYPNRETAAVSDRLFLTCIFYTLLLTIVPQHDRPFSIPHRESEAISALALSFLLRFG